MKEYLELEAANTLDSVSGVNFRMHSVNSAMTELHNHDFMEVFTIVSGNVFHVVNGNAILLSEGDTVLVRPDDRHCYRHKKGCGCKLINLAFPVETFNEAKDYIGSDYSLGYIFEPELPPIKRLIPNDAAELVNKLTKAGESLMQDPKSARIIFKLLITEMLFLFTTEKKKATDEAIPGWLAKTISEMRKKENLQAGLPALRRIACRSDEHISRTFKICIGKTPTDFINGLRVKYAEASLSNTDDKIDSIAAESGFSNLSHFYHVFKGTVGCSPRRYRKSRSRNTVDV